MGGSKSQIMVADNKKKYVIKFRNNPQGSKLVVNEMVVNELATLLKLPSPEGVVANLSDEFIAAANIGTLDGMMIESGKHFGIEYKENFYKNPPKSLFNKVKNNNTFAGVLILDIWTNNNDRNNDGNYLILDEKEEGYSFCIIDHGHCFGQPQWTENITDNVGKWDKNYIPELVEDITNMESFDPYLQRLHNIEDKIIEDIVNNIPTVWDISKNEKNALINYLSAQRNKVEEILELNKTIFPNWKEEGENND